MNTEKSKIWLSSPHMGDAEKQFVMEAFDTNWIAPVGPHINAFEKSLSEYTGVDHTAALISGTSAIHLALICMGVRPGDVVLCQSFTFSGSANPVRYTGATPVFIDSESDTWNMDPHLVRQAIEEYTEKGQKPKAVIAVNLYGMPAKLHEIQSICNEYGVSLIEDAAESLGAHISGKQTGSFGDVGVLSFNGNKIITTSGGGAAASSDAAMIQKMRYLSTQARDDAPHYQHSEIGYNYRMSNVVAGIGRGQMKVLDERVAQRRAVHERYFHALGKTWLALERNRNLSFEFQSASPTGIYFLREPQDYFSNRWLTTIIVNPEETGGKTREDIRLALDKENIEARPLWKPMHLQPVFEEFPAYTNGLSEWLFEYGLCLPSGSNMSDEDQQRVIDGVLSVIAR